MRCLNCHTVVDEGAPQCHACGAQCGTSVWEPRGKPIPWIALTAMIVGMFLGFLSVAGEMKNLATNLEARTIAFEWALVAFFLALPLDGIRWWLAQRQPRRARPVPPPSINVCLALPNARPRPVQTMLVQAPAPRPLLLRTCWGFLWMVVLFLVACVVLAVVASASATGSPEQRQQAIQETGRLTGPWIFLGSIGGAIVFGALGWLPGTGPGKRA